MTTFDRTITQGNTGTVGVIAQHNSRVGAVLESVIDFGAAGNAYAAADVFKVFQIPPGYVLAETGLEVLTADTAGNSGTLQLELGASARGSAVTVASTGLSASAYNATAAAPSGSIQYVQVLTATGTVNAVVRIWAVVRDIRGKLGTPVITGAMPGGAAGAWTYTYGAEVL